MKLPRRFLNNEQRVVWIGLVGASLSIAVAFLWVQPSREDVQVIEPVATSEVKSTVPGGSVELTQLDGIGADVVLREEAALYDPTPMFLPTEWNSSQNALPASLIRNPGRSFENYPAKLNYQEAGLALSIPVEVPLGSPVEVLAASELELPFMGLGRKEWDGSRLEQRTAFIEVANAKDGGVVLTKTMDEAAVPGSVWAPMEFLLAVDAAGLIGVPVITRRSGVEQVDRFFQVYLAKSLRLGERLPPGGYRIVVGP
ncbi:MAG TPA: hypothetical protein PLF88_02340 [Opitutaceae bacterium]|nr:hypothetical protein [Opitutaceae bacterium]HRJ47172.1 hypothetical protein [Opitutaceae bacterium]